MKEAINLIYPVGRTIICDHSPQTDYPWQTWVQDFKDVFPLGAGNKYAAGATGGEATHVLTVNEIPSHSHRLLYKGSGTQSDYNNAVSFSWTNQWTYGYGIEGSGGGAAHNNMPPYKAVKFWTRTA